LERLFFELLQVAIGNRSSLSATPSSEEWLALFDEAKKQSLLGIAFCGVERLPEAQWPERGLVLQWLGYVSAIEQRNELATSVCHLLCNGLVADGFRCCILKGQANLAYYDKVLGNRRTCGDIDIWVVPGVADAAHPVKQVLEYLYRKAAVLSLCYLHAEVKPVRGMPVEVHLRPSFLNAPVRNRRFLKLFADFDRCVYDKPVHDMGTLPVLAIRYDVLFQMNHIYRHLIDEGVGLRQVLDYYMLLRAWHKERTISNESLAVEIERLGMMRFARALMYVLHEVFAMPSEYMIVEMSEKNGRFLLGEILQAGNFGQYDSRMNRLDVRKGKTVYQLQRAWRRFVRNLRFFTSYPEEVLWEPIARVEHLWWRKFRLWRF